MLLMTVEKYNATFERLVLNAGEVGGDGEPILKRIGDLCAPFCVVRAPPHECQWAIIGWPRRVPVLNGAAHCR